MDTESRFWNPTKLKTLYFLLGSAVLALATPIIVAITQPGARFYLLQSIVFTAQAIPTLVAAVLWLPWRSARATRVGLLLARLLFIASVVFYLPIVTGIVPTGGDMIALGYVAFAFVTLASILTVTAVAFTVSWMLGRRATHPNDAPERVR